MTKTELEEAIRENLSDVISDFYFDSLKNGQLVIVTNLIEDDESEELVASEEADMEGDPDFESIEGLADLESLDEEAL